MLEVLEMLKWITAVGKSPMQPTLQCIHQIKYNFSILIFLSNCAEIPSLKTMNRHAIMFYNLLILYIYIFTQKKLIIQSVEQTLMSKTSI